MTVRAFSIPVRFLAVAVTVAGCAGSIGLAVAASDQFGVPSAPAPPPAFAAASLDERC